MKTSDEIWNALKEILDLPDGALEATIYLKMNEPMRMDVSMLVKDKNGKYTVMPEEQ